MIGKVIQEKRRAMGLSQARLAELLGVTAPAVNRWEKDMSYPDATLLAPLARALNTDLNELFSFYDSLSDAERQLVVDRCRRSMIDKPHDEALAEIEEALRQNASDGLLFKDMAIVLSGAHFLHKADDPMIYLNEIARYLERARELIVDEDDEIAKYLMEVYAELGDREKAEASFQTIKQTMQDRQLIHADMLNMLKDYDAAEAEYKAYILRKATTLMVNVSTLGDVLMKKESQEMADLAYRKAADLCRLFGLWSGFAPVNSFMRTIESGENANLDQLIATLSQQDVNNDSLSSDPLFKGVRLQDGDTTAELMQHILDVLREQVANLNN